jgi:C-1 hydroxylase
MDREAVQALMGGFMEAFAGLHFEVEQLVAEGDLVAARMEATATHQRDFMGIPATGRRIRVTVMGQVRIRDGRIVEHWNVMDELHFMQQLGLASAGLLDPVPS